MSEMQIQPVAIIGFAMALPRCGGDLDLLDRLLLEREDAVAPPAKYRCTDASADAACLADCALLDRIDLFDHGFFGLSLREAEQMDPQQRLLLELSCRSIWDAGYGLGDLRGRPVAVVFGTAPETYSRLFPKDAPPLVTGLLPSAQAGRVAHLLDLHGPALTVDTACSSSLFAIHDACTRLQSGAVCSALAGGVRLMSTLPARLAPGSEGILSPGGRARSFDAAADGTGLGEGGAVFLLKRLDRALADRDPIRAVITGGSTNQDGARSNGFTAPSATAQEDVILSAWRDAGVDPETIGFVEAHGTGTRLGDPIEFEALSNAFSRRGARARSCVLSSIKSNIGHLDSAAGAAGLAKALAAVTTGHRYASAHFTMPNPLLATADSALLLSADAQPWPSEAPRRAGVSAFGLTGTNVHLIVEAPPTPSGVQATPTTGPLLIPLAARSEAGLRSHAARLADHCRHHGGAPEMLADLARTQACGRDHERWRACIIAASAGEAAAAFAEIGAGGGNVRLAPDATTAILVFPHTEGAPDSRRWDSAFPSIAAWLADAGMADGGDPSAARLALARILIDAGLPDQFLMGNGNGNAAVDLIRGGLAIDAARTAAGAGDNHSRPDPDRVARAVAEIAAHGDPVLVAAWPGELAEIARVEMPRHHGASLVCDPSLEPRAALLDLIADAYRHGVAVDWARTAALLGGYGRRAAVPTELFARTRCWVDVVRIPEPSAPTTPEVTVQPESDAAEDVLAERDGTAAERALAAIWVAVLGAKQVSRSDDFFDLGGNSLMQTQLDNRILTTFGVKMAVDDIYDFPTLGEMAVHLSSLAPEPRAVADAPSHVPNRVAAPASHAQRRMWVLQELDPASGAYNVAGTFAIEGRVDPARLQLALDGLAARHDILRTQLVLEEGALVQRVAPVAPFDLVVAEAAGEEEARSRLAVHAARPFDLAVPGAARALLVTDGDGHRSWLQLVLHHAVCDEWSIHLLLDELIDAYDSRAAAPPPALQFVDWTMWELERDLSPAAAEDAGYWRCQLADPPAPLILPSDFPRTAQPDHAGAWLEVAMAPELVAQARANARAHGGTLFTWLMTAYGAWLSELCQTDDFIVGVPVAGRHNASAEQIPGCFINTLPLRIDASGAPSFVTLFDRVRVGLNDALDHQRYPFDRMVEQTGAGGNASGLPLVQTLLSLQGARGAGARRLGGAAMTVVDLPGRISWFDLSAVLRETAGGGLAGILAYRTALFEEATIRGFWRDWSAIATAGFTSDLPVHELLTENMW